MGLAMGGAPVPRSERFHVLPSGNHIEDTRIPVIHQGFEAQEPWSPVHEVRALSERAFHVGFHLVDHTESRHNDDHRGLNRLECVS